MPFDQEIEGRINSRLMGVKCHLRTIPKPREMDAQRLSSADYDRFSVAYGLSRENIGGESLGRYIRAIKVPPISCAEQGGYRDRYVCTEQT